MTRQDPPRRWVPSVETVSCKELPELTSAQTVASALRGYLAGVAPVQRAGGRLRHPVGGDRRPAAGAQPELGQPAAVHLPPSILGVPHTQMLRMPGRSEEVCLIEIQRMMSDAQTRMDDHQMDGARLPDFEQLLYAHLT